MKRILWISCCGFGYEVKQVREVFFEGYQQKTSPGLSKGEAGRGLNYVFIGLEDDRIWD